MSEGKSYPVPYRSQLQDKIEPGQTLSIQGQSFEGAERFDVNLHAGSLSEGDIPFHASFRFEEGKVVINSSVNGEWGKEDRKSNPFKAGGPFDIRIRAHGDKFEIMCNQKEFLEFEYRVPVSQVSHLSIDGGIMLNQVMWGGRYYPVPYEAGINGGLGPGRRLYLSGKPAGDRFHINLVTNDGDIAMHFNPRFKDKVIVRNSQKDGQWQNEEREGKLELDKKELFDIVIANESYAFQAYVNNERFCTFAHRMDPNSVHGIQIGGEVELTGIHVM